MIQLSLQTPLSEGTPPTELRLFRAGANATEKGTFFFEEKDAVRVMANYERRGTKCFFDWNHASLSKNPVDPKESSKSAGWFELEVRKGELWAVRINWTPAALSAFEAKEICYTSPAFSTDSKNHVADFINCALTNLPASHDIPMLVAASQGDTMAAETAEDTSNDSKKIVEELKAELAKSKAECAKFKKLSEDFMKKKKADDEEDEEESEELSRIVAAARNATGKSDTDEVVGSLLALSASKNLVVELTARIEAIETEKLSGRVDSLIASRKLLPSQRTWALGMGNKALSAYVESLGEVTVGPQVGEVQPGKVVPTAHGTVTLSDEDRKMAAYFGNTPEEALEAKRTQVTTGTYGKGIFTEGA